MTSVKKANSDRLGNRTLVGKDYFITLSRANSFHNNDNITLKVMLYINSLLTESGLSKKTFFISSKAIKNDLHISKNSYVNEALRYLSSITFNYSYLTSRRSIKILNSYEQKKGYFNVVFSNEYLELLNGSRKQFMTIPKEMLKIDIKNYKHSLYIGTYLYLHKRRNKGKPNENIISVKEILKNCPLLPLYEELDSKQRQVDRAIIKPLEKCLNYLEKVIGIKWAYDSPPTNYYEFSHCKVIFECR